MRKEWFDQLPIVAALCYSAQDDPDTTEAVREALDLMRDCAEVDPTWDAEKNIALFSAKTIREGKTKK